MKDRQFELFDSCNDCVSIHERENSKASEAILDANKDLFTTQCERILAELRAGKRLTVRDMMVQMGIGDPRARIRDLRRDHIIQDQLLAGRFKQYFIVE